MEARKTIGLLGSRAVQTKSLWQICETVYFPCRLSIRHPHTREQYRFAIQNLAEFLGRIPRLADLTDDHVAGMMGQLLDRGLAPRTANERRSRLHALWTWLAKRGHVSSFPTTEPLTLAERPPRAWSEDELRRLFEAAAAERRPVGEISGDRWWTALLAWLWNTSERIGATLALEWDHLDLAAGVAVIPAEVRKGSRKWASYSLWPETVAQLEAIRLPRRRLVFPWPLSIGSYYNRWNAILRRAGLPTDRNSKSHALRVSHATWVRVLSGQHAQTLGHSSSDTTERHYEDPRIARKEAPRLFIPWRTGNVHQL